MRLQRGAASIIASAFLAGAIMMATSSVSADIESVREATPAELRERRNPIELTPERLQRAAEHYARNCVLCHGVRGDGHGPASRTLRPRPMDFTDPKVADEVSDGELFYAIAKGSHGSAMAAYENTFSEEEIWELVAYLRRFAAANPQDSTAPPSEASQTE